MDSVADLSAKKWKTVNYTENGQWKTGSAPLGYGFGTYVHTSVQAGPSIKRHSTYYFRKLVTIDPAFPNGAGMGAAIHLLTSGGAAIYVNGVKVVSYGMPGGTPSYKTLATKSVTKLSGLSPVQFNIDGGYLQPGVNIIAGNHGGDGFAVLRATAAVRVCPPLARIRTAHVRRRSSIED